MAMSTLDNASAQLAIALQLRDLDELEASGTIDEVFIRLQRQQLEIDSGFDVVSFESSRRLALSMAKAVEEDSEVLRWSMGLPRIDDADFERLAPLNQLPTTASEGIESVSQLRSIDQTVHSTTGSRKRARSMTPEHESSSSSVNPKEAELPSDSRTTLDDGGHPQKKPKVRGEQISSAQKSGIPAENSEMPLVQDTPASTAGVGSAPMMEETATATNPIEGPPRTKDCASCGDNLAIDELVKASCEHCYCKDCFGNFIEASLETNDNFPPNCCKIPISFNTVAGNVSTAVFERYSTEQSKIKNATALYCGIQGCGVRIEKDSIKEFRATCVACRKDTCTKCRGEFSRKVDGKNVGHLCKKDKAREEVLALAEQEGWQTCYQCGNMVALNYGCHHMR